jgi:hypothetical protein
MILTYECNAVAEFDPFLLKPPRDRSDLLKRLAKRIDLIVVADNSHRGLFRTRLERIDQPFAK